VGRPAHFSFDDPDFMVSLESITMQAGMKLWHRSGLGSFPLLGLH